MDTIIVADGEVLSISWNTTSMPDLTNDPMASGCPGPDLLNS